MARRDQSSHDVRDEPHLQPAHGDHTDAQRLDEEPVRATSVPAEADEDLHAASDEPAILVNPIVDLDRSSAPGFAALLERKLRETPHWLRLLVCLLAIVASGPWSVIGTFAEQLGSGQGTMLGVLTFIVAGPIVEEMMKVAILLWLVERQPWLIPGAASMMLIALASGLGFGAIENLLYEHVYLTDLEPAALADLMRWRWSVTMPMHAVATMIATIGIVQMYRNVLRRREQAVLSTAVPWLIAAIVFHGGYNAFAIALQWLPADWNPVSTTS